MAPPPTASDGATVHVGLLTDTPGLDRSVAAALGDSARVRSWHLSSFEASEDGALVELVATSEVILLEWSPDRAPLLVRLQKEFGWSDVPVVAACERFEDREPALLAGADFAVVMPVSAEIVRSLAVAHRRRLDGWHTFHAAQRVLASEGTSDAHPEGPPSAETPGGSRPIELSPRTLGVRIGGGWHQLPPTRFALLRHLLDHAGEVVTREELLASVWNVSFDPGSNTVEVYVHHLRRFLKLHAFRGRLETVRNVGYRLVLPLIAGVGLAG